MSEQPIMLGNRYRLDEVIGRGGMAEVWRAWDTRLGRDVAVKRLRVDLATDPTFQARFQREAQSAAGLNHPNIVAVYDTGAETDPATGIDIPFIVMELVQGTTLRDLLRDGRQILPERSLEFTAGVLDGLAYAHKRGIVHRDIKPGNVMLTTTGSIKVMDFGIARAVSETSATMTQTAAVIGTAQYLSPEQARGETVDTRSDIYSVGCLLYELLTSRPPFIGDSPVSVAYQHVREQPIPPSQIDSELTPEMDTVVLTALAKSPDDRYQTAQAMRDDIQRLLDGKPPLGAVAATVPAGTSTRVLSDRMPPGARPKRGFSETSPIPAVVPVSESYADDGYVEAGSTAEEILPTGAMDAEKQTDRRIPILVIVLSGLLVILLIVAGVVLHAVLTPKEPTIVTVAVPSVLTATESDAKQTIQNANLTPKVNYESGPVNTKGQVTRQAPDPNTLVPIGSTVEIWVNNGPLMGVVPNITGMTESEARKALTTAGFTSPPDVETATLGSIEEPLDYVAGQVLTVSPDVGTSVPLDSVITLTLATGKTQVPDFSGMPKSAVTGYAQQFGFSVSFTNSTVPGCQDNTVLTQKPDAGTYESRKNKIYITICVAPVVTPSSPETSPEEPPTTEPTD